MVELFWLLLPVAALSGWIIGRRGDARRGDGRGSLHGEYFQGLNYLLNEQPDKAIEVFTRMVEVDSDTVETHLALGNLFRRRGEVDRAIRIHQNLIARPSLSREQRIYALLELGQDYLRAGLLDRAESLFSEVVDMDAHVETALHNLLDIYQREKEWDKAITVASRLETRTGQQMSSVIAQFYCEQAEQARDAGEINRTRQLLKRALSSHPGCVRASIIQGNVERAVGHHRQAIKAYQRITEQDIEYLPEVLPAMQACYEALERPQEFIEFLESVQHRYEGVSVMLLLADLIRQRDGEAAAADYLTQQLRRRPSVRGLDQLIELNLAIRDGSPDSEMQVLRDLFSELLRDKPAYTCRQCGFSARTLHWHCPSCRSWAMIRPIQGVQGE
ncbi:MAG: lipopolysaccharide assembly protein LapB [Aquisalimonadaceae bacterium]